MSLVLSRVPTLGDWVVTSASVALDYLLCDIECKVYSGISYTNNITEFIDPPRFIDLFRTWFGGYALKMKSVWKMKSRSGRKLTTKSESDGNLYIQLL